MSNLNITRPPQFLDPWFVEIEQVWDEIEAAVIDNNGRITTLETSIISGVVTSVSKSGDPQIQGAVTITGTGAVTLTQVGQNIDFDVNLGLLDHGTLLPASLLDDDHPLYILVAGGRAFTGDQSFGNNQATNFRVENIASAPGAGNQGRLIFDLSVNKLKIDDGAAFSLLGETDHGLLDAPSLLDDDHPQYLLTDGTRSVTGDITVNGLYKSEATESLSMQSQVTDGASAVGHILDTSTNLVTAGALLLSVRNNGVEKLSIDKDGNISVSGLSSSSLVSATSIAVLIDTDNNSTTETFTIETNSPTIGVGSLLFEVNEAGQVNIVQAAGGLRIGSLGVPSDLLDVDGDASVSGELKMDGSGLISSISNLILQIDSNNDESASLLVRDGSAATILSLSEAGDMVLVSGQLSIGLGAPTEALDVTGNAAISGDILLGLASTVKSTTNMAFQIDTDNNESALFNWLNGTGTTIMSLNESGDLVTTGTISGGASPFKLLSNANTTPTPGEIAFELDTQNDLPDSTDKLLSLKMQGVEKFFIRPDGTSPSFEPSGGTVGGYQELVFSEVGFATESNSNTSYAALSGTSQESFTTPVSGAHKLDFTLTGFGNGANSTGTFRIVIDKGLPGEIIAGDSDSWSFVFFNGISDNVLFSDVIDLSSGTHTFDLEVKVLSNTFSRGGSSGYTALVVSAQGSGINGLEVVEAELTADVAITTVTPSWQSITSLTVNTLENERVFVSYTGRATLGAASSSIIPAYRIDGGTPIPISLESASPNFNIDISFHVPTAPLSAGQHTIEFLAAKGSAPEIISLAGSGGTGLSESKFRVMRHKSMGIGAGTIVSSSGFLGAAKSITSSHPTYEDTGLVVSFTTIASEEVLLNFVGSAVKDGAGGGGFYVAYQLDAGSDIPTFIQSEGAAGNRGNISFSVPVTVTTAGLHTIKIRAARDGGGTWTMPVIATAPAGSSQQIAHVVQYRGGLIPVRNSLGTEIVSKPSALEFGNGAIVTNNNGVARIDYPNAALGGYMERVLNRTETNSSNTSATFLAINGFSQGSFTTPVSGKHSIRFHWGGAYISGTSFATFRIVIDKGLAGEIIAGDNDDWTVGHSTLDGYTHATLEDIVTLSAGSHTIDYEVKVTGNGVIDAGAGNTQCYIEAQGSGINGLETLQARRAADFTVTAALTATPGAGMEPVTDMSLTVNTLEGERVRVSFVGSYRTAGASANNDLAIGYRIDGGTPVSCVYSSNVSTESSNCDFSILTDPLSAGQHIIDLTASSSTAQDPLIFGYNGVTSDAADCRFQVIRHKVLNIGAAEQYIDRGDPAAVDFTTGSFTNDSTWRDLDLSSIVPAEAAGKRVFLYIGANTTTASKFFAFREKGNANGVNIVPAGTLNAAQTHHHNVGVEMDSSRVIQYFGSPATWTTLDVVVTGWMVPGGGIEIPIQEEGVNVTQFPSAINIVGAGTTVTDVGGVATVTVSGEIVSRIATAISMTTAGQALVGVTDTSIVRTITLATVDTIDGKMIEIKDESGLAGTNNIIIATQGAETIDGVATISITVNHGILRVYSDGTNWFTR